MGWPTLALASLGVAAGFVPARPGAARAMARRGGSRAPSALSVSPAGVYAGGSGLRLLEVEELENLMHDWVRSGAPAHPSPLSPPETASLRAPSPPAASRAVILLP